MTAAVPAVEEALAAVALAHPARRTWTLPDETVRATIALVDATEIADLIDQWRGEAKNGLGGRPETFPVRALLVAMAIAAREGLPMLATTWCAVLFRHISDTMRAELGIPAPPSEGDQKAWRATYRTVRYRFHALLQPLDFTGLPRNRRYTPEELRARTRPMTAEAKALAHHRCTYICNRIIEASLVNREFRRQWKGSIAIDATPVKAYARGPNKEKRKFIKHSAEPDGGWYIRDGDHRDRDRPPGPKQKAPPRKHLYGYELSLAISGPSEPGDNHEMPYLIVGMAVLHKPGTAIARHTETILRSLNERGHPADLLGADRLYTNLKPDTFALPARAYGYWPVIDYRDDQLGIQGQVEGAILVEGRLYCPKMPVSLISATIDHRSGRIDEQLWQQRIHARQSYRLRPKGRPDSEGHVRMLCPAAGARPTARCELKPKSMSRHWLGNTQIELESAHIAHPPKVCRQQSITVAPSATDRYGQHLAYGSDLWHSTYAMLRNINEGANGIIKDGGNEALDDPERRRIRGPAAQSVIVAFLIYAMNLRMIDTFVALAVVDENGTLRKPRRRRRKTEPIQSYLPDQGRPPDQVEQTPEP